MHTPSPYGVFEKQLRTLDEINESVFQSPISTQINNTCYRYKKMAFLGAPPLGGQVLGLWPDCCRDINVLLAGHPYYHACKGQKQYTMPELCAIEG